jgi:hypothetical protein
VVAGEVARTPSYQEDFGDDFRAQRG